ncbi:hypothetical protein BU16DRAFT_446586, partial [Lophium mytilinum]
MLSAFTARPIVELKQRDKSKIESILAYGDRVLVGLNTGSLRIYRVNEVNEDADKPEQQNGDNESNQPKAKPADLLREEEKFSRRPVQQLAIIKEANILVSLSDNYVSIHDLQTYALQERLERTRGAATFAVTSNIVKDPSTGIPSIVSRLAVAVKRKIILWTWQDMELSDEASELTLIASVKSLTWATGTKIVAGMDPGFVMVDIESQEISDINRPGAPGEAGGQGGTRFGAVTSSGMGYMGMGSWVPKPMATRLGEGQMLLGKDVNTLFIDTDGNALDKRQFPWASAPEAIGYSYPYMLALQAPAKGGLEVRNPDTLSLLQTISLPNANFLHVPQPNISLAHAGKGFLVASDRCIWRMGALDYDSQIDELVLNGRYDESVSLLGMLEDTLLKDKVGRIREIKMLKAQGLFDLRKYRESLELFSNAEAPPERVIALYPKVIAGSLAATEHVEEAGEEADDENTNGEPSVESSKTIPTPASSLGRSMISKFIAEQKKADSDSSSSKSVKVVTDGSDTASIKAKVTETLTSEKPLEGKDLTKAVNELRAFLAQTRVKLKRFINTDGTLKQPLQEPSESQLEDFKPGFWKYIMEPPSPGQGDWTVKLREVAELVDTTLFRAYMLVSPSLAGPLFRLDNFCDPEVVNEKLYESGRYSDLIDFLHGKKLHREALELLAKFGRNDADGEVAPALRGPHRTVGYLQQLPPEMIDLILEFAEWPLQVDPDHGMEVFLADTENAETLPRGKVLDFLHQIDLKLAVRYLEHIIEELNDPEPDFHQRLIDLYLQRLKAGQDAFDDDEERQEWLRKLQSFLKSSSQYTKIRAFRELPTDDPDFYESRAIVLSKMDQHKQALQIYVFQMKDYQKAEEYCNQTYLTALQPSAPTSTTAHATARGIAPTMDPEDAEPTIYHTLLSLYLSPPPPHTPNWAPALSLLSRHGARLPASTTLDLVPQSLPVKELESYFRGRIRNANSVMNEERIVARLRGVEKVEVEAALLLGEEGKIGGRNRRVLVGEERHCAVCHKRFGGAAIRVYPDGSVVHSGCLKGSVGRKGAGG